MLSALCFCLTINCMQEYVQVLCLYVFMGQEARSAEEQFAEETKHTPADTQASIDVSATK